MYSPASYETLFIIQYQKTNVIVCKSWERIVHHYKLLYWYWYMQRFCHTHTYVFIKFIRHWNIHVVIACEIISLEVRLLYLYSTQNISWTYDKIILLYHGISRELGPRPPRSKLGSQWHIVNIYEGRDAGLMQTNCHGLWCNMKLLRHRA